MKQIYEMSQQKWGKVLTPIKVFNARMPLEFGQFAGKVSELDQTLTLPKETAFLVRERVANINICSFCMDIGRAVTIRSSMNQARKRFKGTSKKTCTLEPTCSPTHILDTLVLKSATCTE